MVIVGAAAAGLLLTGSPNPSTSSTITSSVGASQSNTGSATDPFKVNYDTVTVGYNGGLWNIQFQGIGQKRVQTLLVVLHTPIKAVMCTGINSGLQFANCINIGKQIVASDSPSGPFPSNSTFTGFASGAGPGSAKTGTSYGVTIVAKFSDGTGANQTLTVQASTSG